MKVYTAKSMNEVFKWLSEGRKLYHPMFPNSSKYIHLLNNNLVCEDGSPVVCNLRSFYYEGFYVQPETEAST